MHDITRVRELGRRYFDAALAPAELDELQRLLQSSAEAADEFARLSRLEGELSELFAREQDIRSETRLLDAIARQRRRRWLLRAVAMAVAACVLLAVGGLLLSRIPWANVVPDVREPSNEVVAGEVERDGVVWHVVSPEAEVTLRDGTRVFLGRDSVLVPPSPDDARLTELRDGEGRFVVREADESFVVETPAGRVTALGTEFSVKLTRVIEGRSMKMIHFALAVAVMSGVVQVEIGGERYLLSGGESRAFGQEERNKEERRPATRAQRAVVVSAGDGKLVVAGEGRNERTLDVADSVKVTIDGKAAKLSDLTKGMVVMLERGVKDGDGIVAIRVEGPTISAVFKSAVKGKVTIEKRTREGKEGEEESYPLLDGAKITIDGKPGKIDDLKAGDKIGLGLSADKTKVMAIVKGGGERDGEKRPRQGRSGGEVAGVDGDKNTISVKTERDDREFTVAKDAKVTIDGKEAKLADVKKGMRVVLLLDNDGKTVTSVTVGTRDRGRDGDKADAQRVQGRVKGAEKSDSTITLFGNREKPDDRLFTVAKDAKITIDGKAAKLEEIKEGMNATLVLSEDKKSVKEIVIAPARKREGDR